jgi:hypothetical protein
VQKAQEQSCAQTTVAQLSNDQRVDEIARILGGSMITDKTRTAAVMQHMLNNDLLAPTKNQLKNYGHNIIELYDESVKISISNKVKLPNRRSLNNTNQKLLELLSDFAQTTRYHNLDALSTQQTHCCCRND